MQTHFPTSFFFACWILLWASCTSYGPSVSENEKKHAAPSLSPDDQERIETCISLAKEGAGLRVYHYIQDGSVAFEQTHHILTDTLREGAGYRFREVYNTFANEEENSVEFYLAEFTLRTHDTGGHHSSQDFRVTVKPDTAYLQLDEDGAFELDTLRQLAVGDFEYAVFRLLGHEHNHGGGFSEEHQDFDEAHPPAYYQYWSPSWGTLYIRFSNGSTFLLHHTDQAEDSLRIQPLIEQVMKWDADRM